MWDEPKKRRLDLDDYEVDLRALAAIPGTESAYPSIPSISTRYVDRIGGYAPFQGHFRPSVFGKPQVASIILRRNKCVPVDLIQLRRHVGAYPQIPSSCGGTPMLTRKSHPSPTHGTTGYVPVVP